MGAQLTRMLRADAQDNRDRILVAARALFAENGLNIGMREVARRAEVGPATLYRRFPTKHALIEDAFAIEVATCRQIVEDGCADTDPWHGFTSVIERLTALNVGNRGFVDAFITTNPLPATFSLHRRQLLSELDKLAQRAQTQGSLRHDFVIDDLVLILLAARGLSSMPPATRDAAATRFAALTIDAFHDPTGKGPTAN